MNKITAIGRLVADVEMNETKDGIVYCKFRLACRGGEKDKTDFFSCKAWRKAAELIEKYTKKGDLIVVAGSMSSREYEKDGRKTTYWDLNVEDFEFAGKNENNGSNGDKNAAPPPQRQKPLIPVEDGTIPF